MITPNNTNTAPTALLSVSGFALFANTAAIRAHIKVNSMHSTIIRRLGLSPKEKWEIEPVSAVKVIMNNFYCALHFSFFVRVFNT